MYTRTVDLAFPLTVSDKKIAKITVGTLPAKQVRGIGEKFDLDNDPNGFNRMDYEFEVAVAMTKLAPEVLAQLSSPDYNSVIDEVRKLGNLTAEELLTEDMNNRREQGEKVGQVSFNPDEPSLLVPIDDPINGKITSYRLTPPTVGLTRKVRAERDLHLQGMMVASECSGLHSEIIDQMQMPDFNQLMARISDFLTERSAFFQKRTSTD